MSANQFDHEFLDRNFSGQTPDANSTEKFYNGIVVKDHEVKTNKVGGDSESI